jgi:hypothetical protein
VETVKRLHLLLWKGGIDVVKLLFLAVGLAMSAVGAWTFVWPLWRGGFRGLAALTGLLVLGLAGGLLYFLGSLG